MQADHFLPVGAELGEGPAWIDGALWFVDIKRRRILRHRDGALTHWDAPEMVGWVLPSAAGDMIVGLRSGPHRFDPAGGTFARIGEVEAHRASDRLNDAAIDRAGRIVFGTMDDHERDATGRVHVLDRGTIRATAIAATVITNGPAIAPAGDRLYHVDTLARTVTVHAIGEDGMPGAAAPFLAFTGDEGHPDGAICDAEGGIWLGFYGGWAARRYSPAGVLTDEVRFPVANVTKVALGGADGRTAFATTARQGLDAAALAAQPLAGDVFTFRVAIPAAAAVRANT